MDERNAPLPPLVKNQNLMLKYPGTHELPTAELRTDDGMVKIRPVQNDAEALEFEKMCRQSAEDCESFGIDEFDEEGHFNRKLFRSSNIVLAEQASSGDIVGACIRHWASKTYQDTSVPSCPSIYHCKERPESKLCW